MQFVLAGYGESPKDSNWWPTFLALARRFATHFNVAYTHLELSSQKPGAMPTTKTYRYSERAIAKLSSLFDQKEAMSVAAITAGPDGNMNVGATMDLGFSAPHALHEQHRMLLTIDPSVVFGDLSKRPADVVRLLLHEFDMMALQRYGLAHMMPRERGPGFYFSELYTPKLTDEEKENLDRWLRLQPFYRERIRDIYWGNLLSEGHGASSRDRLFQTIQDQVGVDNVFHIGKDRVLFVLPFDIRDEKSYEANLSMWRRRLRIALSDSQVLM